VHALQFLDVINMKDSTQKAHFYRNTLKEVLPYIPKVSDVIRSTPNLLNTHRDEKCSE
jgi:hypothetical protein